MRVYGVVWAGAKTDRFDEMVAFFRDVIGIPLEVPTRDFAIARMPNTSLLEFFGPTDEDHDHFSTGPVAEFLVDDVEAGANELRAAGVEVWGPDGNPPAEGWMQFRAPDGTVWGLTASAGYRR